MKPGPAQIQAALRRLDPGIRLVHLFGPDEALVRERARIFGRQVVEDLSDPFLVVDLDGKAVADDDAILADEAASLPMLGGRKLIRITGLTDGGLKAVEALLASPTAENLVVAISGDLPRTSKLRKATEAHAQALAIACYAEEGARLSSFLQQEAQARGLEMDRDAIELLTRAVGPERDIARNELDKLALYTGGGRVSFEDMEAVGADFGQTSYDRLINAVLGGNPIEAARQIDRMAEEGEAGIALLRAISRRLWQLLQVRTLMTDGHPIDAAISALRPPVFWKEKDALAAQARRWSPERLRTALNRLLSAERDIKSSGSAGDVIAHQCLMALAAAGRSRR